jgi:hypothetical protein
MAEETAVVVAPTSDGAIEIKPIETESEEMEITSEWLESLFANLNNSMQATTEILRQLVTNQSEMTQMIQAVSNRVPDNLTQMISSQQETIQGLVRESMETVRNLLIPPQPQPTVTEPQNEVVVDLEVPEKVPVAEPTKPKRHRI